LRYNDRPNGFDAQLISTWSAGALSRSDPTYYRPDSYIVFDAIIGYKPQIAPGLTLRASVLNISDARYFPSLAGTTTYTNTATAAVAMANPIELRTAPGRTFKVGASYAF
jgi:hemoglobin/transferrin/lactoferrin receptor protein